MIEASWLTLRQALDNAAAEGRVVEFWLRDDDAIEPTDRLDQLLSATARHKIPLALAVIPAPTGKSLAERLSTASHVTVVQHGWAHTNHAPNTEKKQEFGGHRPIDAMLADIEQGRTRLERLYPQMLCNLFVPPWNRIADELATRLPEAGLTAISTFGPVKLPRPFAINSTLDVMDWSERRGRTAEDLIQTMLPQLSAAVQPIGILTHHLVHDLQVWSFLDKLFDVTASHPAVRWLSIRDLVDRENG